MNQTVNKRGNASTAVVVVLTLAIVVGALYMLDFVRAGLSSECGGFSCYPGSVVLPGKDLHHFFDHASAACAWSFDDLTPSAVASAKAYAKDRYPVGEYAEMEQMTAYAGCLEGIRKPLHTPSLWVGTFGAVYEVYDSAARDCARRGVGRVAREFEVAPTPAGAATAYAAYRYSSEDDSKQYSEAFEGCLEALLGPPRDALQETDMRVTVPGPEGVRITRGVLDGVRHYFVEADAPRRLLADGWMTPLFSLVNFRGLTTHPVRVHLYTSTGRFVLTAGKSTNGYDAWMEVSREQFVPCGPVWYGAISGGHPLDGPDLDLTTCPRKPRRIDER